MELSIQDRNGQTVSISVGASSDTGPVRDENEDAYGHFAPQEGGEQLFVVADGMGGHARGREASTTTIEVIRDAFFEEESGGVLERLRRAFHRANSRVFVSAEADEQTDVMGTTGTVLALVEGSAYIAHVGDSRAYRYRDGSAEQLTEDHTVVRELRRRGAITEEEARTHPQRGVLTRAVGARSTVKADLTDAGAVQSGDHFLLCTDGLEDLAQDTLRTTVLGNSPQAASEELVRRATENGGTDNATALVVRIDD